MPREIARLPGESPRLPREIPRLALDRPELTCDSRELERHSRGVAGESPRLAGVGWLLDANAIQPQWRVLVAFAEEHRITPVVGRMFPFEQIADAHRELEERRNVGKVVVQIPRCGAPASLPAAPPASSRHVLANRAGRMPA